MTSKSWLRCFPGLLKSQKNSTSLSLWQIKVKQGLTWVTAEPWNSQWLDHVHIQRATFTFLISTELVRALQWLLILEEEHLWRIQRNLLEVWNINTFLFMIIFSSKLTSFSLWWLLPSSRPCSGTCLDCPNDVPQGQSRAKDMQDLRLTQSPRGGGNLPDQQWRHHWCQRLKWSTWED